MVYLWSVLSFAGLAMALAALLMVAERLLINYGICKLDINAGEKPLEVNGGQTLLAALYSNDIFIPSACGGKGSCENGVGVAFNQNHVWFLFLKNPLYFDKHLSSLFTMRTGANVKIMLGFGQFKIFKENSVHIVRVVLTSVQNEVV